MRLAQPADSSLGFDFVEVWERWEFTLAWQSDTLRGKMPSTFLHRDAQRHIVPNVTSSLLIVLAEIGFLRWLFILARPFA